jgi:hypothetical protein
MNERGFASSADPYSPQRRTALVLTGTGTAGAYHAGVLRALHEAGVKIDVVGGRGVGTIAALFAAVDGSHRLWEENGYWRGRDIHRVYPWSPGVRTVAWALAAAAALVALPLLAVAAGSIVFPVDFVLKMLGLGAGGGLASWYLGLARGALEPEALPTWLPRLVVLVMGAAIAIAAITAWMARDSRRARGAIWWRVAGAPIRSDSAAERCWVVLWDLIRGVTQVQQPSRADLGRRYTELLSENLGQPGFRELFIVAHDQDARRDVVFALVADGRRRDLVRRATIGEGNDRRAEVVDLAGLGRDHLVDAVAAALTIPLATEPNLMTFAPDSYWRGETHRLCDRPGSLGRLLEELATVGVKQIVLVSAAPEPGAPHALEPARLDGRGRIGELLQAFETAALGDIIRETSSGGPRVFVIRPAHNPVAPLDFSGGFDARSDRAQGLGELMSRGYEDAYHQFIEPVVGASGERVGEGVS